MYRPYRELSGKELLETGLSAAVARNLETLSYCLLELAPERRKRSGKLRHQLEYAISLLELETIPWLETAAQVSHRYCSKTTGHYSVYAILLCGVKNKELGHALYVGETGLSPEERFANHKAGHKSSPWVRKYGKCLLPSLYEHLNPMGYAEVVELELSIARSLVEAGIPVCGKH
jgi:hypothetical protein